MKAIVVTDQAAGTAGMKLVERSEPQGASLASLSGAIYGDVVVQVHASGFTGDELSWPSTWIDRLGQAAARKLLPDILSYNPREPTRFPQNGRTLSDDVVDFFLSAYTNGRVTGDKVGPHRDLLDEVPVPATPTRLAVAGCIR